jgi:hypothetical protein
MNLFLFDDVPVWANMRADGDASVMAGDAMDANVRTSPKSRRRPTWPEAEKSIRKSVTSRVLEKICDVTRVRKRLRLEQRR